ncbi:hypothetical protein [Clavibacter michiganensis]|nr:hypothetical protein [Clavibacter michiganensis]
MTPMAAYEIRPLHSSSTGRIAGPNAKPRPTQMAFQAPDPMTV